MRTFFFFVLFLALVLPTTGFAARQKELTEQWAGEIYTASYRAGVCVKPNGELRGLLLLKTMYGDIDEYHFYGHIDGKNVEARHGSGHHFVGKYENRNTIVGTITLKSGRKIRLRGKRKLGARVSADCAPE